MITIAKINDFTELEDISALQYVQPDNSYGSHDTAWSCSTRLEAQYKIKQLDSNYKFIITLY